MLCACVCSFMRSIYDFYFPVVVFNNNNKKRRILSVCRYYFVCFARFTCDFFSIPRNSLLSIAARYTHSLCIVCDSERSSFVLWLQFDNCHPRVFTSSSIHSFISPPLFYLSFRFCSLTNLNYGIRWHNKTIHQNRTQWKAENHRKKETTTILFVGVYEW